MIRNILRWLTILFQSIAMGALILYGYAMFRYRNTWELLDKRVKTNVSMYLTIGLISLGIFILIKVIEFILFKQKKRVVIEEKPQYKEEFTPNEAPIYVAPSDVYQHDEFTPTVQVVEQKQEIPKERQAVCPNCSSIVDKDAYICLSCGILLNKIDQLQPQTQNEKVVYKEVIVKNDGYSSKNMFISAVVMVLMVLMMFVAYDYTKNNGVFFNEEMSQLEKKQYVYTLANEVLTDFEDSIKNNRVRLSRNNSYFSLSDLGYVSYEYNPTKSYVAVNERAKEYYIILQGQGKYEDYSIDATQKSKLEMNSVKINSATTIPAENNTLFIEGQIFYKGDK